MVAYPLSIKEPDFMLRENRLGNVVSPERSFTGLFKRTTVTGIFTVFLELPLFILSKLAHLLLVQTDLYGRIVDLSTCLHKIYF